MRGGRKSVRSPLASLALKLGIDARFEKTVKFVESSRPRVATLARYLISGKLKRVGSAAGWLRGCVATRIHHRPTAWRPETGTRRMQSRVFVMVAVCANHQERPETLRSNWSGIGKMRSLLKLNDIIIALYSFTILNFWNFRGIAALLVGCDHVGLLVLADTMLAAVLYALAAFEALRAHFTLTRHL